MTVAFNYLGKLGQLGNQMFQYAATLGVARKLGIPFTIPNHKEIFDDGIGNKLRIELFDCFDIQPDSIGVLDTGNVLAERGFEFNESVFDLDPSVDFASTDFQTEKYFEHCSDEVRKRFTLKNKLLMIVMKLLKNVLMILLLYIFVEEIF